MADVRKFLRNLTGNPSMRRLGALSGNMKGIKGTFDSMESTIAKPARPRVSDLVEATTEETSAPEETSVTDQSAPTDPDGSGSSGESDSTAQLPLPEIGALTSASEDAIVDPSEQVLEHIDLNSWKWPAYFAFSLTRIEELFPTGGIPRGVGPVRTFVTEENDFRSLALDREKWPGIDDSWTSVGDVLSSTYTDAWLVTRDGVALAEEYAWPMKPARRHMLFSVSKSVVSTVVGSLTDAGLICPGELVTTYLPRLADSGYAGATVRDVLDMRSGVRFSEEYLVEGSEIRALFEAVDMVPRTPVAANGIKEFLTGLTSEREHGGPFLYRSCETDVLGWICEAVTGRPFAVVASEFVWSKIGAAHSAQVCQDHWGGSIVDGAISATLRDLARFGEVIARGGVTATGQRVLSQAWIDDIFTGGPDSAEAFAQSASGPSYPGGMYRSQFWVPSAGRDVVVGIGIHGQMLYIDRATQTVGVKFSSDPEPVRLAAQHGTLAMFEAIAEAVPAQAVPQASRVVA
ncbi:serine hydrolase [Brevibacterium sp.]|uniref:serine hydrolase domain-containing protein n=1 Tax=Brevibacterium sp. TaxID=1701 RepID=UPI002811170A|nr:serine hydrolase [Brevibacterium sp.]